MVVSIIFKMIQAFYEDTGTLPPVLFVSADNCGRENKVKTRQLSENSG